MTYFPEQVNSHDQHEITIYNQHQFSFSLKLHIYNLNSWTLKSVKIAKYVTLSHFENRHDVTKNFMWSKFEHMPYFQITGYNTDNII